MSVHSRVQYRTCEHNYEKYMTNLTAPFAVSIVNADISIFTETKSVIAAETNYYHATAIDSLL